MLWYIYTILSNGRYRVPRPNLQQEEDRDGEVPKEHIWVRILKVAMFIWKCIHDFIDIDIDIDIIGFHGSNCDPDRGVETGRDKVY